MILKKTGKDLFKDISKFLQ